MQEFLSYRVPAPSDLTAAGTRRIAPADGLHLITDAGSTVADTQVRVSPLEKEQICWLCQIPSRWAERVAKNGYWVGGRAEANQ